MKLKEAIEKRQKRGKTMTRPTSVKDRLPKDRQRCLWWCVPWSCWNVGLFSSEEGRFAPGYFQGNGIGCYVCDGSVTHWMPEPPPPEVHADSVCPGPDRLAV